MTWKTQKPPSGIPAGGAGYGGPKKGKSTNRFSADNQPPQELKDAGRDARAVYLAALLERQEKALKVIDRVLEKAETADDPGMLNVGAKVAFEVMHSRHGKPAQAIGGSEQLGPVKHVVTWEDGK